MVKLGSVHLFLAESGHNEKTKKKGFSDGGSLFFFIAGTISCKKMGEQCWGGGRHGKY